jgi:hypothetical protein
MKNERLVRLSCSLLASGFAVEEPMRTRRAIIISAILALGLAGPVMTVSTAAVAAVPAAHTITPTYFYHG